MSNGCNLMFPSLNKPSKQSMDNLKNRLDKTIEKFKNDRIPPILMNSRDTNYLVDVYQKKSGKFFYLCAKCRRQTKSGDEEFYVKKFARIECCANSAYNLAHIPYMAPTKKWYGMRMHEGLNLENCIKIIEEDELYHP